MKLLFPSLILAVMPNQIDLTKVNTSHSQWSRNYTNPLAPLSSFNNIAGGMIVVDGDSVGHAFFFNKEMESYLGT